MTKYAYDWYNMQLYHIVVELLKVIPVRNCSLSYFIIQLWWHHSVWYHSHVILKLLLRLIVSLVKEITWLVELNSNPLMASPLWNALVGAPSTPNTFTVSIGGMTIVWLPCRNKSVKLCYHGYSTLSQWVTDKYIYSYYN